MSESWLDRQMLQESRALPDVRRPENLFDALMNKMNVLGGAIKPKIY